MKYAKINVIDVLSGKRVGGTIVFPFQIALIEWVPLNFFTLGGKIRHDLEIVSEEEFSPVLFGKYLEWKQGKISKDQFEEAVWDAKSLRPVNMGDQP